MAQVTKDSLQAMVNNSNAAYVQAVIGRALWAIFQRQTADEQETLSTNNHNNIGFTGADARSGSLTAKYWKKHGVLADWMIEKWQKPNSKGYSRLSKYHRQLNEIAGEK
jgi:hypothetical protein